MTMYRFLACTVGAYMTSPVATVMPATTLRDLGALFAERDFNAFPVVEHDRVVGLVTKFDLLKAFVFTTGEMVPHYDELMERRVGGVMTKNVVSVEPAQPLTRVLQLMVDHKARSFTVMTGETELVGMISREDIMRALRDSVRPEDPLPNSRGQGERT